MCRRSLGEMLLSSPGWPLRDMHSGWRYGQLRNSWRFPKDVARQVNRLMSEDQKWHGFRAQDIGMLLTGIISQARGQVERRGLDLQGRSLLFPRLGTIAGPDCISILRRVCG